MWDTDSQSFYMEFICKALIISFIQLPNDLGGLRLISGNDSNTILQ